MRCFDIKTSIVLAFTSGPRSYSGELAEDGNPRRMSAMALPEPRIPAWRIPYLAFSFKILGRALLASMATGLVCCTVGALVAGLSGLFSALLGTVAVVAFLGGGSPVQLAAMGQGSQQAVGLVIISYGSRVAMLGLVLVTLGPGRSHWTPHVPSVVASVVAVTLAWICAMVATSLTSRVPVYDTPYEVGDRGGD